MPRPRKLTPIEEFGVYQRYNEKRPLTEIAYKFGVSVATVLRIISRFREEEHISDKE